MQSVRKTKQRIIDQKNVPMIYDQREVKMWRVAVRARRKIRADRDALTTITDVTLASAIYY